MNSMLQIWQTQALPNICRLLHCEASAVADSRVLSGGRTNISFAFSVGGQKYVYRHPGEHTDIFVCRSAEKYACETAARLGLDDSLLVMDAQTGFKLSRFIEETRSFDFASAQDIARGALLLRTLHEAHIPCSHAFDPLTQARQLLAHMEDDALQGLQVPEALRGAFEKLHAYIAEDGWPCCLCHGDPKGPNFMISGNDYRLIDWEYAGTRDIGYDIGHYAAEIGRARMGGVWTLAPEDAAQYFGGKITAAQYRHIVACFAVEEYFWSVWGAWKSAPDVVVRCGRNAEEFAFFALSLYEST